MDDLSTIFYIILAIIYVIYSAIKRGKPKDLPTGGPGSPPPDEFDEATQGSPQGDTQRRPTFEDLLREFTEQPEPVREKQEVQEKVEEPQQVFEPGQPVWTGKKAPSAYDQYQNVEMGDMDVLRAPSVFKAPDESEEDVDTSGLGVEIREMLKNPDGLKKAVLLNEIIRPKYF